MPVRVGVDPRELEFVAKQMKEIDKDLQKEFRKDLKKHLTPYAREIAKKVPKRNNPPLSGFAHNGRTQWRGATGSAYVNPIGGRAGSMARIEIFGTGAFGRAAFKMVDLAGTRDNPENDSGYNMIEVLGDRFPLSANGKGGRFAWAGFMEYRPKFLSIIVERVDVFSASIARRILLSLRGIRRGA
jgi:hypothetical protein